MSKARPKKAAANHRRRGRAQHATPDRERHEVTPRWALLSFLRSVVRSPLGRQMLLVLPVAALPRLWAAFTDQGMLWPDEIYQGPEQGHRLAFGYGFVPWEFEQGVRSWIYPGLLGILFKGLALLGVRRGLALMIAAKCLMALWALVGLVFAMKLAERLAGLAGSLAAGLLLATFPPSLAYDARCTTEAMTGPLLVAATFFATDSDRDAPPSTRAPWAAGVLAATAVALRPPNAIVLVGLFIVLLVGKRWKDAQRYAVAAAIAIASAGLLDAVTWGAPFHALVGYLHFNLLEGRAAQFGVEPFTFYADVAWTSVGLAIVAIGSGLLFEATKARGPVLIVLAYLLAHSLEPHKELRFLLPVVPLGLALAGAGIAHGMTWILPRTSGESARSATMRFAATASVILAVAMAYHASNLTLADLGWGRRTDDPSDAQQPELHLPAWRYMDSPNRLLAEAGEQNDICALALAGLSVLWTGGYAYLHRDVPLYPISTRMFARGSLAGANYVIAVNSAPRPADLALVASEGDLNLYRRDGSCGPPPPYYTRNLTLPDPQAR